MNIYKKIITSFYLYNVIPNFIKIKLWGDRDKWGPKPDRADNCWVEWQVIAENFYIKTQRGRLGRLINDSGYKILNNIRWIQLRSATLNN